MADFDVAKILPTVQQNALASENQARAQQQAAQNKAVVTGQPTFWGRIQQVGIGQVNLLNAVKAARTVGRAGTAVLGESAETAARVLPGGQNDLKAQKDALTSSVKSTQTIQNLEKSGKISSPQAAILYKNQAKNDNQTSEQAHAAVEATSESSQSKQGVQMLESTPRAVVNVGEKAVKQAKYLAGPDRTQQGQAGGNQIIKNQAAASKNPQYEKAIQSLKDKGVGTNAILTAQDMASKGAGSKQLTDYLTKQATGLNKQTNQGLSDMAQIVSAIAGGGQLTRAAIDKVTGKVASKELATNVGTNKLVQAGEKANTRDTNIGKKALEASTAAPPKKPSIVLAEKVHDATVRDGGITIDRKGNIPTKGYAYAPTKGTETVIALEKFSPKDVDAFQAKHADALSQPGNHIGSWVDDGHVYLDISRVGDAGAKTISDAQDAKQLAVYDLEKGKEIPTGQIDKNGVYSKNDEASNIHNQYRQQTIKPSDSGSDDGTSQISGAVPKESSKSETSGSKVRKGLGEEGSVNPGQAVQDVKDLIEKHQATTKYSGDIQRGGDEVEGTKKEIASDAVKVAKAQPKLSVFDKQTLQDYRDAKEAGLPTQELPARLKKANDDITALNKSAIAAKNEQARLEGREPTENVNPETYTHREAQGKGSMFDRLQQGGKGGSGAASFGKRTSSDEGRVYRSITDSRGNRRVVAVKNESFGKVKRLTGFEGPDRPIQLGKHTYDSKTSTLTNSKGEQLKLGEATTKEITKEAGQKYYTDPQLTSLKNYVDSRTALENVKYIESIKNHPDFENFASAPDKTAPKGWESVHGLFQFQGYKFEPKTAEALRDIVKNSSDEQDLSNKVGNLLKKTIVYFPLKHNLNQTATYAVDRGLSSLVNPMAYKRGAVSIVQAIHDVSNESPFFQKLQTSGFSLPSADEKAFTNYVAKELKGVSKDDPRIVEMAKSFGTSPARLYNAVSHTAVWQYGDILNVARVRERMMPTLFRKGDDFETAMKNTEKYSLQYKVPSRVGPTKLGRSLSRTLQSPKIFFGRYRYDLYKIMGNTIKDTVNLKTLAHGGKENAQAVDKLAAMAFGAALVWPLVDKGLQKVTGNPNANMTAPGAYQIPELINKVRTGKESPETAVGNQAYVSGAVTIPLELQANRDSFTGNDIYDPNASSKQKLEQVGSWLKGQSSFGQKTASSANGSNKAVDIILGIAGTNLPKNSTGVSKLYSLQYDSLPSIQAQAKADAKKGNFSAAQSTIDSYDKQVLQAAKDALKASKTPVPSDNVLIAKLKKAGTYYAPKPKTIQSWKTKTPSNAKSLLGL